MNRIRLLYRAMYTALILSGPTISTLAIFLAAKGLQRPYPAIFGSGAAILPGFGLWFWLKEERYLTQ